MRANDVLGIIQAQDYENAAPELTSVRTMASVPFGCRYRFIDFPLSTMVNAGITQIGIITKDNYQSLMDHVGSGKPWDLARKREGMFLLPPYNIMQGAGSLSRNTWLESLFSIMHFLQKARQEYVCIADTNTVYNFDFNDIFDFHTEKEADITIVYKHGPLPKANNMVVLDINDDARITDCSVVDSAADEVDYCFNIFVMRKTLLLNLLTTAMAHGATSFFKDIIQAHVGDMKIVGYEATGFAEMIDSLKTYYAVNMSLLNPENRESLFRKDNPIITKISDNVPATYGPECKVVNSLVADGCVIEGEVANSLLFRGVTVEKGAVVKNCILMQGTIVHSGAVLDSVIGDKNVTITNSRTLTGDPNFPIYITKNIQV